MRAATRSCMASVTWAYTSAVVAMQEEFDQASLTGVGLQPGAPVDLHAVTIEPVYQIDLLMGHVAADGTLDIFIGSTTCDYVSAFWFTTTAASGNEIREDVIPVPC